MISADGIEVYLKPYGEAGESLKYPELGLPPQHSYDEHYNSCFIPNIGKRVMAIVRFNDDFEMHTASAVCIAVKMGAGKCKRRLGWYTFVQRSHVAGQMRRITRWEGRTLLIPDFQETSVMAGKHVQTTSKSVISALTSSRGWWRPGRFRIKRKDT